MRLLIDFPFVVTVPVRLLVASPIFPTNPMRLPNAPTDPLSRASNLLFCYAI